MANTAFTSILDLFDHSDIPYDGEPNISRIKKQLVAEFDFSPTGMIRVKDHDFTKNDVLAELDRPDFLQRLEFQKIIRKNHYLTVFLEDASLNMPELEPELNKLPKDDAFEEYLSPYFAHSFNIVSRNYLQQMQMQEIGHLLRAEEFIRQDDREEGFRSVSNYLDENIRLLRNVSSDNFRMMMPQLKPWLNSYWSRFLNNLPDEFYDEKNEIVLHLINLSVRIQKVSKRDCLAISAELTCVTNIHEQHAKLIINNDNAFNGRAGGSSSGGGVNYWWIIFLLLAVIRGAAHC